MHGYKEEKKTPPLTTFIESFFEKHIELREILTNDGLGISFIWCASPL